MLTALCVYMISVMAEDAEWRQLQLFNEATFYDGYLFEKNPDKDLQDGILRHSTSLYAVKLTDEQLALIGDSLRMNVFVKACCDNYDRIGNINLALVPKGAETYKPDETQRIELGRFITPFMNKNRQPDTVPYTYRLDYLSLILCVMPYCGRIMTSGWSSSCLACHTPQTNRWRDVKAAAMSSKAHWFSRPQNPPSLRPTRTYWYLSS